MAAEIHAVVVTVSDRCARGERADESGPLLISLLEELGARVLAAEILPDDPGPLTERLRAHCDRPEVNLVLTTGGTGLAPRDQTPEATRAVIEREAPGLAEAMRAGTAGRTPAAMLSRGVCGVRSGALVVNLPGSPRGVRECFAVIRPVLAHAVSVLAGVGHGEKQ